MPYKKYKKKVVDMLEVSTIGAGASFALGSIGGSSAVHGQQGIAGATSFLPAVGRIVGVQSMMGAVNNIKPKKKKKRKRR